MKNIYIELDNNYGDLREFDKKFNSSFGGYDRIPKTYELQEILDNYESLYNEKEELETQVGELEDRIKELEEQIVDLQKGVSNE